MTDMLQAALDYARGGFPVFPVFEPVAGACSCPAGSHCEHPAKHPRTSHGFVDATRDESRIREWWTRWPEANLGIATEPSGLLVLDVDPRHNGDESLHELERAHGELSTRAILTGGGGAHYYFRAPAGQSPASKANALGADYPGLDLKARGGYVVAPPSLHVSGQRYTLETSSQDEIAACPAWLLARLEVPGPIVGVDNDAPIFQGTRHSTLVRFAGRLRRLGTDFETLVDTMRATNNRKCSPPLDEKEIVAIARSACGWPVVEDLTAPDHVGEWTAPMELALLTPSAPTMAIELVPLPFRAHVSDVHERMGVPVEMVIIPLIVSVAAIIGRRIAIRPKRQDDWECVLVLWGGVVARPGALKTPAMAEALRPFRRFEAQLRERYAAERTEREHSAKILDIEARALESQISTASKKGGDIATLAAQLQHKRAEIESLAIPEPRLSTQDATVEKLGELLRDNPCGMLLFRDELTGWLRSLDKPGREGDRQFFLEGWNGRGRYTVDRIGRGTIDIPALCVSILGSTQPGPLRAYVREAMGEAAGADGLLQRFQLLVWPDELPEWRNIDRWPDTDARRTVYVVLERVGALDAQALGAERDEERDALPFLRFDAKAQVLFDRWRDNLETRLRSRELTAYPALESCLAKHRSLMPVLALIFHLIKGAETGSYAPQVSESAAALAADWCEFMEMHARKIYAEGGDTAAARSLAEHIENGDVASGDTARDVYRKGWAGLTTPERVERAAHELARIGWLKIDDEVRGEPGPGRPRSPRLILNPSLGKSRP